MNMKKLHKILLTGITLGIGLFLASCGSSETSEESSSAKLQIVTTFYPMYDFTQKVTQDLADVSVMVPAGTDTHSFEPSAKEVAQIQGADVFIYNSEEMETWVPSILESIDTSDLVIINASEGVELLGAEESHNHEHHEDETEAEHAEHSHSHEVDPHIWVDPVLAQEEVANIQAGLIQADPDNEAQYTENATAFQNELQELHESFEAAFEGAENRTFVTQHAAFAYLSERYDLNQVAIAGLSTSQEPSPSELAEIAEFIEAQKVDYIYFGKSTSSNIAETLAYETNTQTAVLDPIESVTEQDQEAGYDYLEAMYNNLESLKLSIQ